MAKANSLSYTAGVSDFDSVNNFAKGEANINESNSNLDQAKNAIEEANKALKIASSLIIIS
jgi:exonuclease VII small subunit